MEPQKSSKLTLSGSSSGDKAMNNLMQKLKQLQGSASPTKSTISKKTPSRKRKPTRDDKNSKITSWLNKENRCTTQARNNQQVVRLKQLDITVNKSSKASSKSLKRTSSFEKYGILLPSFETIVAEQKKLDEYKNSVQQLVDVFDDNILVQDLATDCLNEERYVGELLDCKHLSFKELEKAFRRHKDTLEDIMQGRKYSDRHRAFHQPCSSTVSLAKNLYCSNSLVVFTQEQKEVLLDLMRSEFDPDDTKSNYFFKVLLPEICLLIFMEVYQMGKRKANEYLNKRPLDF